MTGYKMCTPLKAMQGPSANPCLGTGPLILLYMKKNLLNVLWASVNRLIYII